MTTTREQMLQRIREAVMAGNRAGGAPQLPERGTVGYQGGGADPVARFQQEISAAGGHLHVVSNGEAAREAIRELVRVNAIRRVLLGESRVLAALDIVEPLRAAEIEIIAADDDDRAALFRADMGLSGVDHLIAETGSVVVSSRPQQPRLLSLLPPLHVAVAERSQLVPDLFDLFALYGETGDALPACLTIITGPSKTGDIELRLVTGVHGPGKLHVILIEKLAE